MHPSYECKVRGYFGSRYVKSIPNKDCGHNTERGFKFNRQKESNGLINCAVDEMLMQEKQSVSAEKESHETLNLIMKTNSIRSTI